MRSTKIYLGGVEVTVTTEINDLIDGAPGALDTLNELAAAIADDATYSATISAEIDADITVASGDLVTAYTAADAVVSSAYAAADTTISGDIVAQFISKECGEIYAYDVSTEITITNSGIANKVQVTAFDTNGISLGMTPDHTNDHITIATTDSYAVAVSLTVESVSGPAAKFEFELWINDGATQKQNVTAHRQLSGGGSDAGSVSMNGLCSFTVGDTVEIWVYNITGTQNVVIDDITLSIIQL